MCHQLRQHGVTALPPFSQKCSCLHANTDDHESNRRNTENAEFCSAASRFIRLSAHNAGKEHGTHNVAAADQQHETRPIRNLELVVEPLKLQFCQRFRVDPDKKKQEKNQSRRQTDELNHVAFNHTRLTAQPRVEHNHQRAASHSRCW